MEAADPDAPSPAERRLLGLLSSLRDAGLVRGVQVAVVRGGARLLDVAFGELGGLGDAAAPGAAPRPVTPASLFPCFSVTKGVVAATIHAALEEPALRGEVSVETLVSELWPDFARGATAAAAAADAPLGARALAEAKAATTLRHVLTHSAGLQHALPEDVSVASLASLEAGMLALERALPLWAPGSAASYHYYSFGWASAGILRGLQARLVARDAAWAEWAAERGDAPFSVGALVHRLVASRLAALEPGFDCADELRIGLPRHMLEAEAGASRLAEICTASPADAGAAAAAAAAAASGEDTGVGAAAEPAAPSAEQLKILLLGESPRRGDAGDHALHDGAEPLQAPPAPPSPSPFRAMDVAALRAQLARLAERGAGFLFDPRAYNLFQMRSGEIPAANGHFSARALALFYDALGRGALVSAHRVSAFSRAHAVEPQQASAFVQSAAGGTRWGLGFMAWAAAGAAAEEAGEAKDEAKAEAEAEAGSEAAPASAAFGHSGAGGSLAFWCARSSSGVAVVVNQLSVDKRATRAILALLVDEFGLTPALSRGF
jgi:hypothetical protein